MSDTTAPAFSGQPRSFPHMKAPFKIGDRVRLAAGHRFPEYRAGDSGTVAAVLPSTARVGGAVYQVRMDGRDEALYPAFYAEELEPEP